jgi:hypothetical protein
MSLTVQCTYTKSQKIATGLTGSTLYTVKKEKKIFLIYKGIHKGSGAKDFLIYEEMGKYLVIYEEAVFMTLHPILLNFLIYEDFFNTVRT